MTIRFPLTVVTGLILFAPLAPTHRSPQQPASAVPPATAGTAEATARQCLAALSAAFIENRGQWAHPARHVAHLGGGLVLLEQSGFVLRQPATTRTEQREATVGIRFANADTPTLVPERPLAGTCSYLIGNDRSLWVTAPRHGAVRYVDPWPGTAVIAYEKDGHLEYDIELPPGGDLSRVEFVVDGAKRLRLEPDGALAIETTGDTLRQLPPITWATTTDGSRQPIASHYELRGADRFGFAAPTWSGDQPLVLDPGLVWSTYLGGNAADEVRAISVDAAGVVTVAGRTSSAGLPLVGAFDNTYAGGMEAFVARFDPSLPAANQLRWCTFLGGSGTEYATSLAVDAAGIAFVAGRTSSPDFPMSVIRPAFDPTWNVSNDAFVCALNPSLAGVNQLMWSTYLGGAGDDEALALSLVGTTVVVTGTTSSANFPTVGAVDAVLSGPSDAFVAKLAPTVAGVGQLQFGTFLGGNGDEAATASAAIAAGTGGTTIWVTGRTNSTFGFPVTANAFDASPNGRDDAFLTRYDLAAFSISIGYSTLFGGNDHDSANALVQTADGIVSIAGGTESTNLPMLEAQDSTHNGSRDAFLARFDLANSGTAALLSSTYLGGSGVDQAAALAVDSLGIAYLAGDTASADFPVTRTALDMTLGGPQDGFVARIRPRSSRFHYVSFVGGVDNDRMQAIAVDTQAIATFAGWSYSPDYPANGYDVSHNGHADAVITRAKCCPALVSPIGAGCPSSLGVPVQTATAVGPGQVFTTTVTPAPMAVALLLLGFSDSSSGGIPLPRDLAPIGAPGCTQWVSLDYQELAFALPTAQVQFQVPGSPSYLCMRFFTQWCVFDPMANPLGIAVSNAIDVSVGN